MIGKIKRLYKDKGFGFITTPEYPKDVFFHVTDFNGTFESLEEGDELVFEIGASPKGVKAERIKAVIK